MTTITLTPDDTGSERADLDGLGTTFVTSFAEFCAGIRDGKEIEARYRRLSRMSNSELADIGLTRADLHVAVAIPFGRDPTVKLRAIASERADTIEDLARQVA